MSNTFYNVTSTTSFSTDGDIFDVLNGASLDLTGSSNTVVVQSRPDNGQTDTAQIFILGNNNTVVARDTSGIHAILGGSGNVVMMGSNSLVSDDGGIGDTITVGAGGWVAAGQNATVNATGGGTYIPIVQNNGVVVNGNNDSITLCWSSSQVNGDGNQIFLGWGNDTLKLNGSNNTIDFGGGNNSVDLYGSNNVMSFSANGGAEQIRTASGYWLMEDENGSISYSASSVSLKDGVATIGLGNGNVVTVSDVGPDAIGAVGQINQLISAMASYQNGTADVSTTSLMQATADTSLFASAHH